MSGVLAFELSDRRGSLQVLFLHASPMYLLTKLA